MHGKQKIEMEILEEGHQLGKRIHRNSVLNQARFGESTSVLIKESPVTGSLDLGLKA